MTAAPRVLVIDADPAVHQLVRAALAPCQGGVDSAFDAGGLEAAQGGGHDLVLADPAAAGLSGPELLERIRAKVIVLASNSSPRDIIECLRRQAFGYFTKPLAPASLAEMVSLARRTPSWREDLCLRSASPEWLTIEMRCRQDVAERLQKFLCELEVELPPAERDRVGAAFRELLANAIEHGARSDPEATITVAAIRTRREVIYYIRDPGEGFCFGDLAHAAISNTDGDPMEHLAVREHNGLRPGGFGILLARSLVDELIYNDKGNEVLLIKYRRR